MKKHTLEEGRIATLSEAIRIVSVVASTLNESIRKKEAQEVVLEYRSRLLKGGAKANLVDGLLGPRLLKQGSLMKMAMRGRHPSSAKASPKNYNKTGTLYHFALFPESLVQCTASSASPSCRLTFKRRLSYQHFPSTPLHQTSSELTRQQSALS